MRSRPTPLTFTLLLGAALVAASLALSAASAIAEAPAVKWALHSVAQPTYFQPQDANDQYTLLVENVGSQASSGTVTITDELPPGVTTATSKPFTGAEGEWNCPATGTGAHVVKCTLNGTVRGLSQDEGKRGVLGVPVSVSPEAASPLINVVTISGGGASTATTTSETTQIGSPALSFQPFELSASALDAAGALETRAGAHPAALTTSFLFTTANGDEGSNNKGQVIAAPVEHARQIVLDLPPGVVGNPQAAEKCSLTDVQQAPGELETVCPPGSRIGVLTIVKPPSQNAGSDPGLIVYNVVPEHGYPAEFAVYEPVFKRAQFLYGSVVGSGADTHVRVTSGPLTEFIEFSGISTIFDGNPPGASRAFFTNPSYCSPTSASFETKIHVDSWQRPGRFNADGTPDLTDPNWKTTEPAKSPAVTGCGALQFNPTVAVAPRPLVEAGTTQADEPSGYEVDLRVPQNEAPNALATPPLKDATVTMPAGVSISPSAANGLVGCQETGAEGIQLAHNAPGHCPEKSKVGTVTVVTPLLTEPLEGSVYVAQPTCGGPGQPECTEAAAEHGEIFALYLEVEAPNSGVNIKLKGAVEVGGNGPHSRETGLVAGQVRTTFAEDPQQPFSELKLRLNGGAGAPLANPQTCGGDFTATSALTPWSSPTPAAPSSAPFAIDWDGAGGACPASPPFAPAFNAGTLDPQAGAFSPFTLTFSRHDREQDLSGVTVQMPPGLLGKIAGIQQCPDAKASAGACAAASRIGSVTAAAGAGPHPLWQSGTAYLTGPYRGAPFGLSFVVPAVAGPYRLGNIVVRAAIYVDPHTAALTVVSDPLPQSVDGVPLRVRTINVTADRPGFTFNPTWCEPTLVGATVTGVGGTSVPVSSRFQAAHCASLPFKPTFSATTQASGNFHGASLDVKISQTPGEAAIRKVDTQLPLALPSRLVTLQKACTESQFAANPAGCPAASDVGVATATTPVLNVPLTGPAYLVSHGGAAFPDLDIVLQGEGVTIVLVGNTDIKKGITFSRFETVPDAPIASFELNLPGGSGAVLAAIKNLCAPTKIVTVTKHLTRRVHGHRKRLTVKTKRSVAEPLVMPTTITGQNGAVLPQTTKIAVTGCSPAKSAKVKQHQKKKTKRKFRRKKK
jgi:hypothetical protein